MLESKNEDKTTNSTRREVLRWAGAAALLSRTTAAGDLPVQNTGLEHFGMTVPEPEMAARFYGRIFDPQLFQEREPPPRFYVKLGTGYLAFGGNKDSVPSIDHFCALVDGYKQGELRTLLVDKAGVKMGNGPLGMATDPDGIRFQTLGVPGGLARTIIPAQRISQDPPLFQVVAPQYMILRVTDVAKSAEHYTKIFGAATARKADRTVFAVAKTQLILEPVTAGEKPSIYAIGLSVAGFDRKMAVEKLKKIGVDAAAGPEKNTVRFKDSYGFVTDLKGEA